MKIHREGHRLIKITGLSLVIIILLINIIFLLQSWMHLLLYVLIFVLFGFVVLFFRIPRRNLKSDENLVLSSADGKVVAIEEVTENEYFHEKRLQVSVFMSIYNVHRNLYPVSGEVKYVKYHPGSYLVARHPKSSEKNERTTVVIQSKGGNSVLMRQIAGAVARRVVCYAQQGMEVKQASELGFIKFGSRVDLLLPVDAEVLVCLGQKVQGGIDAIARFRN